MSSTYLANFFYYLVIMMWLCATSGFIYPGESDKLMMYAKYTDFDAVLEEAGGFGKYQKLVIFLVIMPALLPTGFFSLNIIFLSATPDSYGCRLPVSGYVLNDLNTVAPSEQRNGASSPSRCRMYALNWTSVARDDALRNSEILHGVPVVPCTDGWIYSQSVYPSTAVTEWDLVCDREVLASLAFAASTIGALFGAFIWAFIADRYGRKPAYFSMIGFQLIFAIATAFAPSLAWFFVFRICVGMCTSFCYVLTLLMAIEITGLKTRALVSVICSVGYTSSGIILVGIAYFVRPWRDLALASSVPLLAIFALWPFFPESPRWLLAQKRYDELEIWLKKVAKTNGNMLDRKFEQDLQDILRQIDETEHAEKTSFFDLFRKPNLRKKTLLLSFINFCNVGIYSGLNLYSPSFGTQPHLNLFLSSLIELPPYVFAKFICDRVGRRLTVFYSMLLCSVVCLVTQAFSATDWTALLVLALAAKFCITLTYLVSELYEEEIFPTVVRGQGHSVTSVLSQIAGVSVPFVVALGSTYAVLPLIIFGCLCILGAVSVLFLPETVGKELPQTLTDGEVFGKDLSWRDILTFVPEVRKRKRPDVEPPNTMIALSAADTIAAIDQREANAAHSSDSSVT